MARAAAEARTPAPPAQSGPGARGADARPTAAIASLLAEPPEPQLATLVTTAPAGAEWLHEQKFDGYRMLAVKDGAAVRLLSRRHNDWSEQLAPLVRALAALPCARALLDGEVVVFADDGRTSFQALQNALGAGGTATSYVAFDLLAVDDQDLRRLPLDERKTALASLIARVPPAWAPVVRYSDHVDGAGEAFFREACAAGLEGIVSKRRDRPYHPGRNLDWQKTKCLQRQELVIGGFTDPRGSRSGLGSLLVGHHEGGALRYAGKVGTGFGARTLDELHAALAPLERRTSPFTPPPERAWTGPGVHWVEPRLVAEVVFTEWTDDGRLRHPVFKGLRVDKDPATIVREHAVPVSSSPRAGHRGRSRT